MTNKETLNLEILFIISFKLPFLILSTKLVNTINNLRKSYLRINYLGKDLAVDSAAKLTRAL